MSKSHHKLSEKNEKERKFAIRLNATAVAQVMENESEKFTFPWLKTMHYNYVVRFVKEYDLIFSSKESNQVHIPKQQMDIHRNEFETSKNFRYKSVRQQNVRNKSVRQKLFAIKVFAIKVFAIKMFSLKFN